MTRYQQKPLPADLEPRLRGYLSDELRRIGEAAALSSNVTLTTRASAPERIADGQIVYANGTDWDPGDGEGVYARVNGAWVSVSNQGLSSDDLSDVTSIAMLDENETVTGRYTFSGDIVAPLNLDSAGTGWTYRHERSGSFAGGFYIDLTSQYWLNSSGQTVMQNAYGSKDVTFGNGITVPGSATFNSNVTIDTDGTGPMLTVGDGANSDGDVLLKINADRPWQFKQRGTGASTGVDFQCVNAAKYFRITDDADNQISRWYANSGGTNQFFHMGGVDYRIWDSSNSYYVSHGSYANSKSPNTLAYFGDSSNGGSFRVQKVTLADDATATFLVGSYYIAFLLNTYNGSTFAHWGGVTTQMPNDYGSGSNIAFGTTNPNTDGKVNIWPSASGEVSIKNRMGSQRAFYLFTLEL